MSEARSRAGRARREGHGTTIRVTAADGTIAEAVDDGPPTPPSNDTPTAPPNHDGPTAPPNHDGGGALDQGGTDVLGQGGTAKPRDLLVLHGGMGDPRAWEAVTHRLGRAGGFRTVRMHRRQYRMDLPRKVTMADEVQHVAAVAATLDKPLLAGHSSGAVLALEAVVADPELYSGVLLYEPPVVIGEPLGGRNGEKTARARAALAAGRPGRALTIFQHEVVGVGRVSATISGLIVGATPYRVRVERQLDDNDALDALGERLTTYRKIDLPVLLIGGDRSQRHLVERLDALERTLPRCERVTLRGQGHIANVRAPGLLASVIGSWVRPPTTS